MNSHGAGQLSGSDIFSIIATSALMVWDMGILVMDTGKGVKCPCGENLYGSRFKMAFSRAGLHE